MKHLIIVLIFTGFIGIAYAHHDGMVHTTPFYTTSNNTEATVEWEQASYGTKNGTGFAKVIVIDPDMNKIPNYHDVVYAFVFSDSYQEGIQLELYETEKNSGTFERKFGISEFRSAPSVLFVQQGDTATVRYWDTTPINGIEPIEITETTLIGNRGPPLERVLVSSLRVEDAELDIMKNPIILVDQQIEISMELENNLDRNQNFTYLVLVQDETKKADSLSWIAGSMTPLQSMTSSQSWTPSHPGKYYVTAFVWESVNNPTALSPPTEMEVIVKDEIYS